MGRRHDGKDPQQFVRDIEGRQKNIVFHEALRGGGGRALDAFLWRGSPNPSTVQKLGAWLLGLFFITAGLAIIAIMKEQQPKAGDISDIAYLVPISLIAAGIRVFRNGFPNPPKL